MLPSEGLSILEETWNIRKPPLVKRGPIVSAHVRNLGKGNRGVVGPRNEVHYRRAVVVQSKARRG